MQKEVIVDNFEIDDMSDWEEQALEELLETTPRDLVNESSIDEPEFSEEATEEQLAQLETIKEQQRFEKHIYRIGEAPPAVDKIDTYIERYKQTDDEQHLVDFLYHFERRINRKANAAVASHALQGQFWDVKATIIVAILEAIERYDISLGVPFTAYLHQYRFMDKAINEYLGSNAGLSHIANFGAFKKAMAIYYKNKELFQSTKAALAQAAQETSLTEQQLEEKAIQGENFRYPIRLDAAVVTEGEADDESYTPQYGDDFLDPARLYPKSVFYQLLYDALDMLDPEKRYMLLASNNICHECFKLLPKGNKKTYAELANEFCMVSESAVQKANRRSETQVLKYLCNHGGVEVLEVRFIRKEKIETGLERYVYGYKVNLSAQEGIIDNIYDKKRKIFWGYDVVEPLSASCRFAKWALGLLEKHEVDKAGVRSVRRLLD